MNRTLLASLLVLALPLAGCPESMILPLDTGVDGGGGGFDAGIDAPSALDTGVDAPVAMDTGRDAGMGTDGSILPPLDAPSPFGDTGTVGDPAWVDLDVRTDGSACPALEACGGDVLGTWDVTGGCFEVPGADMLDACPGATFEATGQARGRVTFGPVIARRVAQSIVTANVFVPTLCVSFIGDCEDVEGLIQSEIPDSACVTVSDGCECEGRFVYEIDDMDGYSTMDGQIISAVSDRRWDYCIEDGTLRYQDVTEGGGEREPGIIELGMP